MKIPTLGNLLQIHLVFFSIDKNMGNIINRKITKQPVIIVIEVFKFIVVN